MKKITKSVKASSFKTQQMLQHNLNCPKCVCASLLRLKNACYFSFYNPFQNSSSSCTIRHCLLFVSDYYENMIWDFYWSETQWCTHRQWNICLWCTHRQWNIVYDVQTDSFSLQYSFSLVFLFLSWFYFSRSKYLIPLEHSRIPLISWQFSCPAPSQASVFK